MRIIGVVSHDLDAKKLCSYLERQGIGASFDVQFDAQNGQMSYSIWAHDEDRLEEAKQIYEAYKQNSGDVKYEIPLETMRETDPAEPLPREPVFRYQTHLTLLVMIACALLFFLNSVEQKTSELLTPIQKLLLYDAPDLAGAYWKGFYQWLLSRLTHVSNIGNEGPLFTNILQGEIWRIVTPVFLHNDLLHIVFNMLWVWVLSRPIEQRIGSLKLLLFIVISAAVSNTVQYLMSGPLFIGYSGVVLAMAGFIWMREKVAPWEGYPLSKSTVIFLAVFVGAIFALQAVSFLLEVFTSYQFAPQIANSAHIMGAIIGLLLGRLRFFARAGI